MSGPYTCADRLEPTTSTKAADAQCATGRSLTMLIVSKLVPPGNLASEYTGHMAYELYDPSLLSFFTHHVQPTLMDQLKCFDRATCHGFLFRVKALISRRIVVSQCATL